MPAAAALLGLETLRSEGGYAAIPGAAKERPMAEKKGTLDDEISEKLRLGRGGGELPG